MIPSALSANSTNRVVSSNAAANAVVEDLVNSASLDTKTSCCLSESSGARASVSLRIKSGISCAFCAGSVDSESGSSAVAFSSHNVENFVGEAGNTADSEIRVIKAVDGALLANSSNQAVISSTDASNTLNEVSIRVSAI